jgi:hypothetical protein
MGKPTLQSKIDEAARRFADFTGVEGVDVALVTVPPQDDVFVVIGRCEAIAYTATRDGETASYQHEFRLESQPLLAASFDGKRLYLLDGRYEFTDHGIEDR